MPHVKKSQPLSIIEQLNTLPKSDSDTALTILHQAIDALFQDDRSADLLPTLLESLLTLPLVSDQWIRFTLPMEAKGKARPRLGGRRGNKRAFMPEDYTDWMDQAISVFALQWRNQPPLQQINQLIIRFVGCSRKTDVDNGSGSVMDALVKAGVIRDDNATVVPHLDAKWVPALPGAEPYIEILINPAAKPHAKTIRTRSVATSRTNPSATPTNRTRKITALQPTATPDLAAARTAPQTPDRGGRGQRKPRFVATVSE